MKNIGDRIKANPVVVVSIVVAILAIVALFLFVRPAGKDFLAEMEKRKADENNIMQLSKTAVIIPGEKPDDPPRTINITVNEAALNALNTVNDTMTRQFTEVFGTATEINQRFHAPMLDDLFPRPRGDSKLFDAQTEYRRSLLAMLGRATIADKDAARLNAGAPFPQEKIVEELEKVTNKFLAGFITRKTEQELGPADTAKLNALRRETAMKLIHDWAQRITIYAVDNEEDPGYPFHVGKWATQESAPTMRDIWEGQMALWIQQDLVRAIALANKPSNAPGALHRSETVLTAPVKLLVGIRVIEGYVGINTMGAMGKLVDMSYEREKSASGTGSAAPPGFGASYFQSTDIQTILSELKNYNPDQKLPEAFNVSMTGRVGNAIYDVRHVQLSVVCDSRQIPALFEAIGKVNFMTVINTRVTDVDEYHMLEQGMVLGEADSVMVDLLIETIWLREWTSQLMPKEVKDELGIVEKTDAPAGGATGTGPTPPAP